MNLTRMSARKFLDRYIAEQSRLRESGHGETRYIDFTNCDFSGEDFRNIRRMWNRNYRKDYPVDVSGSVFERANLVRFFLSGSRDNMTIYNNANMPRVYKIGSDHRGASFSGANLHAAHLENSDNTPYKEERTVSTDFSGIRGIGIFWSDAKMNGMKMHGVCPDLIRLMRFSLDEIPEELKRRILGIDLSEIDEEIIRQGVRTGIYPPNIRRGNGAALPFVRWGEEIWQSYRYFDPINYGNGETVEMIVRDVMKALGVDYEYNMR